MGIERSFEPDLNSAEICKFLGDTENANEKFSDRKSISTGWINQGYSEISDRIPIAQTKIDRVSFIRNTYVVESRDGRLIKQVDVYDPVYHPCMLSIGTLLFLKPDIDAQLVTRVEQAFQHTDLNDVDDAELTFLREGLSFDDYQVVFFFELIRTKDRQVDRTNSTSFEQQVGSQTDDEGKPIYRVERADSTHVCEAPSNEQDPGTVIDGDINNPDRDILEHERREMEGKCEDLELVPKRVGTAFELIETKTKWELRKIKIGKCTVMKTKLPIIYSRRNRQILIAYVVAEKSLVAAAEKAILDCIKKAAEDTAILILVTAGSALPAAKVVFIASCLKCLESKFSDQVKCLKPDLKLVTERTDWVEGIPL